MKKVLAALATTVAIVAMCVMLSACSTGIAGTYKFSSMSMNTDGMSVELKVGESYMGVTLKEDAYVLTVKEDNTWEMEVNLGEKAKETGTWEAKDGKYFFKPDGQEIELEVTLSGNTLSMAQSVTTMVFKK